jgi:3-phenylpropionate/trans-cinnamate dioxygenase ferredoxin subunit
VTRPGEFIRCPWHGWEFDIRTGQSWCDPKSVKARNLKVQVEPGSELVKGPYVAESFPVTVEEDYLVIDL